MPPARLLAAAAAAAAASASVAAVQLTGPSSTVGAQRVASLSTGATHAHLDPGPAVTPMPSPQPTPAPTAIPTPVPVQAMAASTPVPAPPPPAATPRPLPPPPPPVLRNLLVSADGTLRTGVGVYTDCSGDTPLTRSESAIDTCIPGPLYFVGHNLGVFTPLMHMGVGAVITYYDGSAAAHRWRVVSVRAAWRSADGVPSPTQGDVVAQFQTCVVADGSVDRILDVVPA
jgi:hypothetical protein